VNVYLVPVGAADPASRTYSETAHTDGETGQRVTPPSVDVSFESFVHWHLVDGVMHERPVGGDCEYCAEDDT
jgi:hypothetical protein